LIIFLAHSGARIGKEALELTRGLLDFKAGKAKVTGKGNKEAFLTLTAESAAAIKDYFVQRSAIDAATGKPLASLPVFARHDNSGKRKTLPLGYVGARNAIVRHSEEALKAYNEKRKKEGSLPVKITPHYFRHYFVTNLMNSTGGNLEIARKAARHVSMNTTKRYSHVYDEEIDAEIRKAAE
jgi:site-specific recombinase XerD